MNSAPFATLSAEAPAYWLLGNLWIVFADGQKTGGRFTSIKQLMPKGTASPSHVHHFTDEWFYVLEDSMDSIVDGQPVTANVGDTLWVHRSAVHSFTVTSSVCRVLNGYESAGVEQVIMQPAQPAERWELPPPGPRPDIKTLTQVFNNYWSAEAGAGWEHGVGEQPAQKRE